MEPPKHCPLCGRELIEGPSVNRHHWIPKSKGGSTVAELHRICHDMLHRTFSREELAAYYNTPERLLTHAEVQRFVKWVRKKPADYVDYMKRTRAERRQRK